MTSQSPTSGWVQQSIRVLNWPTWADTSQLKSSTHAQLHTWNIPQAGGKRRAGCRRERRVSVKASWADWVGVTELVCRGSVIRGGRGYMAGASHSPLSLLSSWLQCAKLCVLVSFFQTCVLLISCFRSVCRAQTGARFFLFEVVWLKYYILSSDTSSIFTV